MFDINSLNEQQKQKFKRAWNNGSEESKMLLKKKMGDEKYSQLESIANYTPQNNNQAEMNFNNETKQDYSQNNQYNQNENVPNQNANTEMYGKDKVFDPNAKFDSSTLTNPNAQISVKEGKAQQTGMPDYEIDSEARMNEITNNLNAYWNTNKELFRDRATFNQAFSYNNRKSEAQRALLDSFWKRKEDSEKISNYSTPDSILKGLNDGELTKDQMDLIKEKNPELYKGYEQKIEEDTNLRIINKVVPNDTLNTVEAMQRIIEKANIQSTPYDIDKRFQENLEKYGVLRDSNRLREQQDRIEQEYSDRDSEEAKIRSQYAGSYSSAYISAKLSQVARRYTTRIQGMQQRYSAMLQGRNQNLALAQADTQALIQQTAEDQRVFNNTLKGFGFAMNIMSFETPEQQRQAQLYKEQTSKEIDLAYRSKLGDIELKQKRKSIEQQMEIQSELSDLNIKDPKKLRRNIYNELDPYYKKYGDIIMRSQQQVADDVITYAKKHGVSVGEALTQNFIQPLQSKKGYKNVVNAKYGLGGGAKQEVKFVDKTPYVITSNEDGTVSVEAIQTNQEVNVYQESGMKGAGLVNNNPGNIKDQGFGNVIGKSGTGFARFPTPEDGFDALVMKLTAIRKNNNSKFGKTIRSLIKVYAPKEDGNNPTSYAQTVARQLGVSVDTKLTDIDPTELAKVIAKHESGYDYNTYGQFRGDEVNSSYDERDIPLYKKYRDRKITSADIKNIGDYELFKKKALERKRAEEGKMTPLITTQIKLLEELKELDTADLVSMKVNLPFTKGYDLRAKYNRLLSSTALQYLVSLKEQGATFGALSDNELKFITDASTNLKLGLNPKDWKNNINEMIRLLKKGVQSTSAPTNPIDPKDVWGEENIITTYGKVEIGAFPI